jgi:hypothetical protein
MDQVRRVASTLVDKTCEFGVYEEEMNRSPPLFPPVTARYRLNACVGSGRAMLMIFRAHTVARWYFDESGELIDLEVVRAADSL